eukprot:1143617-Pelagomonas_calceolata.AAC.10
MMRRTNDPAGKLSASQQSLPDLLWAPPKLAATISATLLILLCCRMPHQRMASSSLSSSASSRADHLATPP